MTREDRLKGVLLGTAVGDAVGLPYEGIPPGRVGNASVERYNCSLFLGRGVVSDDTELSALLAQSILKSRGNDEKLCRHFRAALLGWFLRLPWGIGLGTLRSCLRIATGSKTTGCPQGSAGNGAAMRAAILGVYFNADRERRLAVGSAVAQVTHLDDRAVQGALFVAEVAARFSSAEDGADPFELLKEAEQIVTNSPLLAAIDTACELARSKGDIEEAIRVLGNTGYVVHTVGLVTFCFLRYKGNPAQALVKIVSAGGDTDTNAAVLGAWFGAAYGPDWIPVPWRERLQGGPFGRAHLESLGAELAKGPEQRRVPRYSWIIALIRNVAMFPVVLGAGLRIVYYKMLGKRH